MLLIFVYSLNIRENFVKEDCFKTSQGLETSSLSQQFSYLFNYSQERHFTTQ
jgi:hypothetical protein